MNQKHHPFHILCYKSVQLGEAETERESRMRVTVNVCRAEEKVSSEVVSLAVSVEYSVSASKGCSISRPKKSSLVLSPQLLERLRGCGADVSIIRILLTFSGGAIVHSRSYTCGWLSSDHVELRRSFLPALAPFSFLHTSDLLCAFVLSHYIEQLGISFRRMWTTQLK